MTRLDQLMHDAVTDTHPGVDRLTTAARAQGTTLRRRRRTAAAAAGLGVAAVVMGVALVLPNGADRAAPDGAEVAASPGQADSADRVPITGRSTAALLRTWAEEATGGTTTAYAGQGDTSLPDATDTYAELELTVPGRGTGMISVNVQDSEILEGRDPRCLAGMRECSARRLPTGATLVTYTDAGASRQPSVGARVAEVVTPDGLRVVARVSEVRVLTDGELRDLVADDRWGLDIAGEYADAGAALEPYLDLDAVDNGPQPRGGQPLQPTPTPTG